MFTNGNPWYNQYDFNESTQDVISSWINSTSLPEWVYYHASFVTNNRLYLVGGVVAAGNSTKVYSVPINSDGTLSSPWVQSINSLPAPVTRSNCVILKDKVYLIGGYNSAYLTSVYVATIGSDGVVGSWSAGTPVLPNGLADPTLFVNNDTLYVYGKPASGGCFYKININSDGTLLAPWVELTNYPLFEGQKVFTSTNAIVLGDWLYFIAGQGYEWSYYIYKAPFINGVIGTWTECNHPPVNFTSINCKTPVVTKNRVWMINGYNGEVYKAPIVDDVIGTWVLESGLPAKRNCSCCVVTSTGVYMTGGMNPSATATVIVASFSGGYNDYTGVGESSIPVLLADGYFTGYLPTAIGVADTYSVSVGNTFLFNPDLNSNALTTVLCSGKTFQPAVVFNGYQGACGVLEANKIIVQGLANTPVMAVANFCFPSVILSTVLPDTGYFNMPTCVLTAMSITPSIAQGAVCAELSVMSGTDVLNTNAYGSCALSHTKIFGEASNRNDSVGRIIINPMILKSDGLNSGINIQNFISRTPMMRASCFTDDCKTIKYNRPSAGGI